LEKSSQCIKKDNFFLKQYCSRLRTQNQPYKAKMPDHCAIHLFMLALVIKIFFLVYRLPYQPPRTTVHSRPSLRLVQRRRRRLSKRERKSSDSFLISDVLLLPNLLSSSCCCLSCHRPAWRGWQGRLPDRPPGLVNGGCSQSLAPQGAFACSLPRTWYTRRTAWIENMNKSFCIFN